jgi:hypothetical protein
MDNKNTIGGKIRYIKILENVWTTENSFQQGKNVFDAQTEWLTAQSSQEYSFRNLQKWMN